MKKPVFKGSSSNRFDQAAHAYHDYAECQQMIAAHLDARLTDCDLQPKRILDLGSGTGFVSQYCQQRYPQASIVALDRSWSMLQQGPEPSMAVMADMDNCPFQDHVFDLVISNMAMHWSQSLADLFPKLNRILTTNGVLLFSMAGPGTFDEWRDAWSAVDQHQHVLDFPDPGQVAQWMHKAQLNEPVVDCEQWVMSYPSFEAIHQVIKATGVRLPIIHRQGMLGKQAYQQLVQAYEAHCEVADSWPLSYHVTMGYARAGSQVPPQTDPLADGVAYVSLDSIKKPAQD